MSTLVVDAVQVGSEVDTTRNMVIRTNKDGTFTLARGNVGATTQDIAIVDAQGNIIPKQPGAIIQVVTRTDAGSGNITSTGNANTSVSFTTITPRSTNSKLKIRVSFYGYPGYYAGGVNYLTLNIYENNTTAVGLGGSLGTLGTNGVQNLQLATVEAIVTNTSLTPRNFSLWASMNVASGTGGVTNQTWEIMEIAA